jgi:hypothetical protein
VREVAHITIHRCKPKKNADGGIDYGHFWIQIGQPRSEESESYGWWPVSKVNLKQTALGVGGDLNGQTCFGGTPTRDPYHDIGGDIRFHPLVAANDPRTDQQIAECIRSFVRDFVVRCKIWRWPPINGGENCQSFQSAAMNHCRLSEPALVSSEPRATEADKVIK